MGLLGGLIVKLGADSKGYNKTLTKAGVMAKNVGKKIKGSLSGKMVGLFGVAALGKFTKDAVEAANKVDHLSRRLNIGTEDFQKLDFPAKMSGSTTDSLAISLQRIDEAQGRLAVGNKETAAAFKMFGIAADEAIGIDKADLFKRVAGELKGIVPTGQQKRAIQQLFGAEAGLKNIRMFTEGLDDMMQTASDSGTVMADEQIRMAGDFKDQLTAFKAETLPIFLEIATGVMGAAVTVVDHMKAIIDALAAAIVASHEVITETLDKIKSKATEVIDEIKLAMKWETMTPQQRSAVSYAKALKKQYGTKDEGLDLAGSLGKINTAFMETLTQGMTNLEEKKSAREKASKAAREKTGEVNLSGLGGGGKPTKLKADALARIGGFRGGISPEINLLKQQIQQQKMIARASKETASNTKALT